MTSRPFARVAGGRRKMLRWLPDVLRVAALSVLMLLSLLPVFMLLIQAGKSMSQFEYNPWGLMLPYHFENYLIMAGGMARYVLNTTVVCLAAISISLVLGSFAAFVFARFDFPGKELLYYAVIALMMVPFVIYLVPQFVMVHRMGLTNTRWALILPYAASGAVFAVFLIRPFIASLPQELFEAARLDGANEWQEFVMIGLPLCMPIIGTVAIILLLGQWNDIIWPSVANVKESLYTVSQGVYTLAAGQYKRTPWGLMYAAFTVASLPIILIFAFTRNLFIRGLSSGALKM